MITSGYHQVLEHSIAPNERLEIPLSEVELTESEKKTAAPSLLQRFLTEEPQTILPRLRDKEGNPLSPKARVVAVSFTHPSLVIHNPQ